MILTGFLGVLAGSVLWLDRVFVFQFMVSRPMIMGPLIGLVMGDLRIGTMVGISLELLWLNAPPVGAYLPNDESFCTAVAVPVAVLAGTSTDPAVAAGLSILLCLPFAFAGRALDTRLRTMNERLLPVHGGMYEESISMAMFKAVLRAFFMAFSVICSCTLVVGSVASFIMPVLPKEILAGLPIVPFACVVIGLAALVSREIPRKSHAGMFTLGLALVLLLTWIL
jgi:mannose/fructose/N-acetylgalactosamine-specific phosphotransferase system component IIC